MTTTMSDLPEDLVVMILSRVPLTSLRSVRYTCKKWNALSRNRIFGKVAETKNQFLGFLTMNQMIFYVKIDLQGICNDGNDFIDLSIKHTGDSGVTHKAYHCDGLMLLWKLSQPPKFMVWNPYLGQRRKIVPMYDSFCSFAFGYDNNRNHKILLILNFYQNKNHGRLYGFNIYEFSSNSWRVLDITPKWKVPTNSRCVTLRGNAYFYAQEEEVNMEGAKTMEHFLLCFDFTSERCGPRLSLPFLCYSGDNVNLSCVKDKQLALLYQPCTTHEKMEIWVTDKIDFNEVLWTKWIQVDTNMLVDFPINPFRGSFFIDEEKKVVVVVDQVRKNVISFELTAHIIGEDGYFNSLSVGKSSYPVQPDLFGYFPSLVQIE